MATVGTAQAIVPGGFVVALVGPDGVGKTSQTAEVTRALQRQFRCSAVYLGSGNGGWRLRRFVRRQFHKWRPRRIKPGSETSATAPRREFYTNHSVTTALAGLGIALERYVTLRRAMRLASSGSIVISDRWPQNLQPGLFDGPLQLIPSASAMVRLLSRFELDLYRRMQKRGPDLMIHLVSDYETSSARKPGDRSRSQFDLRMALMQEMRLRNPNIRTVDARNQFDVVTAELLECVRIALTQQTAQRQPLSPPVRSAREGDAHDRPETRSARRQRFDRG